MQALDEARHWARQTLAQKAQLEGGMRRDLDALGLRLFPAAPGTRTPADSAD
ncbi:MAG: hypothetical protein KGL48_10550 [Sphingomonadales bacterium]|nr:hypothetical protein [Sphingomonadales bacterium]MDE2567344.1 hypothetical protein [Sphingomonadales bacterium]